MLTAETIHPYEPPERKPRLRFRVLRWLAARLPLREILVDGEPYLERYYIAGPIATGTTWLWPATDRPKPRLTWLRRTWYLHRFHAPDPERALHNHPWTFRGRVLAGAYAYTQQDGARAPIDPCVVNEGDKTAMPLERYHRIDALLREHQDDPPDEVWTLLRAGRLQRGWGYLVEGEHIPHNDYHDHVCARAHKVAGRRTSALIRASIDRARNGV